MRKAASNRAKVLGLLDADPAREWTAEQVAVALSVPNGTAGSCLHAIWKDRHLARRKVGPRFLYRSLSLDLSRAPAPVAGAPDPTPLVRVAALWSALGARYAPNGHAWTPEQVEVALIVADHVRREGPNPRLAPGSDLWFTGYTGRGDQPPATKERDHE